MLPSPRLAACQPRHFGNFSSSLKSCVDSLCSVSAYPQASQRLNAGRICRLSCGSNRRLQSVAIQPASADAKNFPNGQVHFTATGVYSDSSALVVLTSKDVTWCYGGATAQATSSQGICAGNIAQFAGVDQNGPATCSPTFQGSVYILAGTPARSANPDGGTPLTVYGAAQLTCP